MFVEVYQVARPLGPTLWYRHELTRELGIPHGLIHVEPLQVLCQILGIRSGSIVD
jgi:hypothetical protein